MPYEKSLGYSTGASIPHISFLITIALLNYFFKVSVAGIEVSAITLVVVSVVTDVTTVLVSVVTTVAVSVVVEVPSPEPQAAKAPNSHAARI